MKKKKRTKLKNDIWNKEGSNTNIKIYHWYRKVNVNENVNKCNCNSLEIRKLNICFQFTRIMYVINCSSIARNTLLLISYFFTVSVKKEKRKCIQTMNIRYYYLMRGPKSNPLKTKRIESNTLPPSFLKCIWGIEKPCNMIRSSYPIVHIANLFRIWFRL